MNGEIDIMDGFADNLPDPLFILDEITLKIIGLNAAAEAWLQRSKLALIGLKLLDISADFAAVSTALSNDNLDTNRTLRGDDFAVKIRNQTSYIQSYQVFPVQKGRAFLIQLARVKQSSSIKTDKNESVTMLGRMLAHELKNPLAGIRGAAQLLEADLQSSESLELTALIKTEVDRIGRLADRMESFGEKSQGQYQFFNVHVVLRKAVLLFQNQNHDNVVLIEKYDPSLPLVYGDSDALMQVIVNLISNAIEAVRSYRKDGKIEILTTYRTGIKRRDEDGGTRPLPVEVKIIDNGAGIATDKLDRIFHPFVTSKANGQGLGLSLVSKIVSEHGGLVDVESRAGQTVFSILLPIQKIEQKE